MNHVAKILLLGSGELGKEFTISAKRLGCYVVAVDKYDNAPAMQVADCSYVIDMLDESALIKLANEQSPDYIVPEIEAIRTEALIKLEEKGFCIIPNARATHLTMNRDAIRDLANKQCQIKTPSYAYAMSKSELHEAAEKIGLPCVVKPVMSSSGKGQSIIYSLDDVTKAWDHALLAKRGDRMKVIIEEFIEFESEITLLTIRQKQKETLFIKPIGHR